MLKVKYKDNHYCLFYSLVLGVTDTKFEGMRSRIMKGDVVESWSIHSNGGIHFLSKLCVPNDA